MSVTYSLKDGIVKATILHSAVTSADGDRDAYREVKVLKEKEELLKELNHELIQYQGIVRTYTDKISETQTKIAAITIL